MKIFSKILFVLILSIGFFYLNVNAGTFSDIINGSDGGVNIVCQNSLGQVVDCNIKNGVDIVKTTVNGIEKTVGISVYIQRVVLYVLSFVSFIAVVYIIYTGFRILISAGDEETLKKQKSTILYIIIGIAIMWLAYPITIFIIGIFN